MSVAIFASIRPLAQKIVRVSAKRSIDSFAGKGFAITFWKTKPGKRGWHGLKNRLPQPISTMSVYRGTFVTVFLESFLMSLFALGALKRPKRSLLPVWRLRLLAFAAMC